jgi:hypothetical protein
LYYRVFGDIAADAIEVGCSFTQKKTETAPNLQKIATSSVLEQFPQE